MAKLKVKGTVLSLASGTTYTPVAQIRSFGVDGMETETYESRTIDGTAGIEYDPTGYVEGGSTTFDLLHDPALAGHQDIHDLVTSACLNTNGTANKTNWKIVFANTASTEMTMVAAGVGFSITGEMSDGLAASVTLKHSGCPVLPT
jgi:hypothetical protein